MKTLPALVCLALATPALADVIELRADEWCPVNCDPKSKDPGFMIELAKEAFEAAGHTVSYKLMPWAKALEAGLEGKITGVVGAAHDDGEGYVFPATPIVKSALCLYVPTASTWQFKGVTSLESVTLGTVKGTAYTPEIDKYIAANPKKIEAVGGDDTKPTLLRLALNGKIGAIAEYKLVMEHFLKKNNMSDKIKSAGCDKDVDLFIAFSPKIPKAKEYAKIMDDATRKANQSGHLKALRAKYGLSE